MLKLACSFWKSHFGDGQQSLPSVFGKGCKESGLPLRESTLQRREKKKYRRCMKQLKTSGQHQVRMVWVMYYGLQQADTRITHFRSLVPT